MLAARTSPGSSVSDQPPQLVSTPGPESRDIQAPGIPGDGDLPPRLADAIDDRIAEILNDLLDELAAMRPQRRLLRALGVLIMVFALAACTLLWHGTATAWTIWACTASVCIAAAGIAQRSRL
jgi:hypothetical protein